jgi:hypothetical protein
MEYNQNEDQVKMQVGNIIKIIKNALGILKSKLPRIYIRHEHSRHNGSPLK